MAETICMVAVVKHEEAFIDEWILYHKMLGINHFFIYDDSIDDKLRAFMGPHKEYSTIIKWTGGHYESGAKGNQIKAYRHALTNFILSFDWVAFLDVDEFIRLKEYKTLQRWLSNLKHANSVSLNWHLFGHNGFIDNPNGLITASLTKRRKRPSKEVKSFTRPHSIARIENPHFCILKDGIRVDGNGFDFTENLYPSKTAIVCINHYQSRSFHNWMSRIERGDVNFNPENAPLSHQWRFDKQKCLDFFITEIARDRNELSDNYMSKFKFKIQEQKESLKRTKNIYKIDLQQGNRADLIDRQISKIFKIISNTAMNFDGIGLYTGLSGMALFCFQYFRYKKDPQIKRQAQKILKKINDLIHIDCIINYSSGLSGYGALVEYLVEKSFLKVDTNVLLTEVDDLLNYHLITYQPKSLGISTGLTGIGKYYIKRLNNRFNDNYSERTIKNRVLLNKIINLLENSYHTYEEFLSVINFLNEAYEYSDDKNQVACYLNYAIDRIETTIYEDLHFNIHPNKFDPLTTTSVLLDSYLLFKEKKYLDKALFFLNTYENINSSTLQNSNIGLGSGSSKLWLTYAKLSKLLKNDKLNDKAINWFNYTLLETQRKLKFLESSIVSFEDLSMESGITGVGMALLAGVDSNETEWLNLVNLY